MRAQGRAVAAFRGKFLKRGVMAATPRAAAPGAFHLVPRQVRLIGQFGGRRENRRRDLAGLDCDEETTAPRCRTAVRR